MIPSTTRSWIFKINKKIVSLTELMAGVKAPSKTCQLFQLMCWPQGYKVNFIIQVAIAIDIILMCEHQRCRPQRTPWWS